MSQIAETMDNGQSAPPRNGRPFRHIPVRAFDSDSKVFFLQSESGETRLGVCFQGDPMTGADENTMERLKSVVTTAMPPGTFLQFGLISEPDVSTAVTTYANCKKQADGLLERLTARRVEFLNSGVLQASPGMNDVHLCRQRVIVSLSILCSTMPTEKQQLLMKDLAGKLREGLSSVGLWLSQMDEVQYLALMRRFFRLYQPDDFATNEFTPLREQIFGPSDSVEFKTDEIEFNTGEYFAKTLSIKHFPKRASIGLMNMLIGDPMGTRNQVTEPYWMSATLHFPDQDKKIAEVRLNHAWITNQNFAGLAHLIPKIRAKKDGMDKLINAMEDGGGVLCEFNFTMTLFSRDKERLNGQSAAWLAWANSYGFEMREDKRILKELYYSLLPLGTTQKGIHNMFRFHTMSVSHAIRILPILGNWSGSGVGGASIFQSRRGTVALFDPYDSPTNYNGLIIAESGAGKSFIAQRIVCDTLAGGGRAWAIDQGGSYKKLCKSLGDHRAQFIEFSETSDICLNPFTHIDDPKEEMDVLKAVITKMAAPDSGLDDFRQAAIESKILAAYDVHGKKANITTVAEQCLSDPDPRIQDIGTMLYPFTSRGQYGHWFNGENNVDLSKDFVVLELQDLASRKTLQQVVLLLLFSSINYEMFLTHGRKKLLLIDEAWALLDDPVMGKAIEAAYRKVRKHDGAAWLVTQNIADLYDSPNGRAIISSSAWQIIMMQKSESVDMAIRNGHLKMDAYQMQMLKSVHTIPGRFAEMMIRSGDNWGVVKLVEDRFAQILFSTKGWERDLIFDRMAAGENVVNVIDQLVMEGR